MNTLSPEQAALNFGSEQIKSGYKFEAAHPYYNNKLEVIYWRIRLKHPNGDKWIRPMHKDTKGKYILSIPPQLKDHLKPIYGLQLLFERSEATVIIVEGEMPADILNNFFIQQKIHQKFIAITSGSATSAEGSDWLPLSNHTCIIWPDNDDTGNNYAFKVFTELNKFNCQVEVLDISQLRLPPSGDCVDWIELHHENSIADLLSIPRLSNPLTYKIPTRSFSIPHATDAIDETEDTSPTTKVVNYILDGATICYDKNKAVYAIDIQTSEARQIHSRQFKDYLTASFYDQYGKTIREQVIREALYTISGIGRHTGTYIDIYRRVALHENCIYLDLCEDGNSRCIKIFDDGWDIIESPPVIFIRSDTMQQLPIPVKGGDISTLWKICNIPAGSQLLVLSWLAETLRPNTPYPVLEIVGEQGSAKSTTHTALRRLIDPNTCDLRAAPKLPEDIFVAAGSNHFISYENISHLPALMQDALCTVSTGGGYAKRKLYTDVDEIVIHAHNPTIVNSIAPTITAQDLIDRTITIDLPTITERQNITDIRKLFDDTHAYMLGGFLDLFSKALMILPNIKLPANNTPRLIEFALLGVAIEQVLYGSQNQFLHQFNNSRIESITRTIDASPVAAALCEWFNKIFRVTTKMAVKDLYNDVSNHRPNKNESWPSSPKGFADALRRAAPALRQLGIECTYLGKQGSYIYWQISEKKTPLD